MKAEDFLDNKTANADAFLGPEPKKKGLMDRLLSAISLPSEAVPETSMLPDTRALGEAAASLGTGAVSWIPAGLSMLSTDLRSPTERARTARDIQEFLTYTPKSEAAQRLVEPVGQFFENYDIAGREYARNIDNPFLATLVHTGTEAIPFIAPVALKGVGAVKGAARDLATMERILERETAEATAPAPMPEAARGISPINRGARDTFVKDAMSAEEFLSLPEPAEKPALPPGQGFVLVDKEVPSRPPAQEIRPVETTIPKGVVDVSRPGQIVEPGATSGVVNRSVPFNPTEEIPVNAALAEIKSQGGLNIESLRGRYSQPQITELVKKRPGLVSKNGKATLDEIADMHRYESGDALLQDILGAKPKKAYAEAEKADIEARYYDEMKQKVAVGDLKEGDKVVIDGEEFKHTGYDKEGNAIIKDGETIVADPFEVLRVDKIKKAGYKEQTKDIPGFSERETFSLTESPGMVGEKVIPKGSDTETMFTQNIDPTKTKEVLKGLADKAGNTLAGRAMREVVDFVHSPDVVMKRTPVGARIYDIADKADLQHKKFVAERGTEFEKAAKGITGEESDRVGMALDGKIKPETLTDKERGLYSYLKEQFSFLLHRYAREVAGNEDAYIKARSLAHSKQKPQVKVSDLEEGKQRHYKGLRTPEERADYLHEAWKGTQDEGFLKAYDALSRELRDYLPHLFDKDQLLDAFKAEKAELESKLGRSINETSDKQFKVRLKEVNEAIVTLEGGGWVRFKQLPRNLRFKFFESRKGKQGYSFDAIKAYRSYLTGIARKIFDEPAVREMGRLYEGIEPEAKTYADWFIRRFAGERKTNLEELSNAITSIQWMRTLGFNPRSALVNMTQRFNTVAEIGPEYSLKGQKAAFTKEGKKLFDESGLAAEVPQVLYEGGSPKYEQFRALSAWMFNKVELGNRRHAFLSGYLKAKEKGGMGHAESVQAGIDAAHKTQFRYGRVGTPRVLSNPLGRVTGQFTSFTIKQLEFLHKMAKEDPKKLLGWLAMAEGTNLTMQQLLDADMSNAIGVGLNFGELFEAFRSLSDADFKDAFRHVNLSYRPGAGLFPSGVGPTARAIYDISKAEPGKGFEVLKRESTPVVWNRLMQAVDAIRNEKDGEYPIISRTTDHPQVRLNARQLFQRTIGPQTNLERETYLNRERGVSLDRMRKDISKEIVAKIIEGDTDGAKALVQKYKVIPTRQAIKNELVRRNLTPEELKQTRKPGRRQLFELTQEGRTY